MNIGTIFADNTIELYYSSCLRFIKWRNFMHTRSLLKTLSILFVITAVVWVTLLVSAYGLCLVLLTAIFYLFYSKNVLKTILGMITSLLYVTGPLSFYGIWFYNEQRKDILPKYVYYAFYPVHLLVLGIITINIL